MKRKTFHLVTRYAILALALAACQGSEEATPTPLPTPEPTATAAPTATFEPTATPEPTATLEPTAAPIEYPHSRILSVMAYDAESDQVILYGGVMPGGTSAILEGRILKDTWSYDFGTNTWSKMKPSSSPGKSDGSMAYDAESDQVILFIGSISESGDQFDLAPASETWAYDYNTNTWTNMEPIEAPYGLRGARMVYDVESDRMILFGGWDSTNSLESGAFNVAWAYDYNTNTWTKMEPKISPPGRNFHAMAYDVESDRVILWGGGGPIPVDVNNVWAYDYNADVWQEMESSGAPGPASCGAMVYDAAADRIILYAGLEFWSFDYNTNTWTQLSDSPLPGNLLFIAMVYNGESDRVIIFGGGPDRYTYTGKTWAYDLNTNTWTDLTRR